mmetsp:Transcript_22875/g.58075  ORF Transcript_22875/g.58075 Transcript_22875/m.58075 type:complete len:194 (+) Transcript_22875:1739-2320(+)
MTSSVRFTSAAHLAPAGPPMGAAAVAAAAEAAVAAAVAAAAVPTRLALALSDMVAGVGLAALPMVAAQIAPLTAAAAAVGLVAVVAVGLVAVVAVAVTTTSAAGKSQWAHTARRVVSGSVSPRPPVAVAMAPMAVAVAASAPPVLVLEEVEALVAHPALAVGASERWLLPSGGRPLSVPLTSAAPQALPSAAK